MWLKESLVLVVESLIYVRISENRSFEPSLHFQEMLSCITEHEVVGR